MRHAFANLLHVTVKGPNELLQLVGLRRPIENDSAAKAVAYFNWLKPLLDSIKSDRSLVIGDFNPFFGLGALQAAMNDLKRDGWKLAEPSGDWSYKERYRGKSTSRIDHALASATVAFTGANYIVEAHGCSFAGNSGTMSDHAVMLVDVDLGSDG